jgi:hypothetical protein
MARVDRRGREREPEVRALPESGPAWTVIGWSQRFATLRERGRPQPRLDG